MAELLTPRAYSATQGKLFAIAQLAEDLPLDAMIAMIDEAAGVRRFADSPCSQRGVASLRQVRALADAMRSVQAALAAIGGEVQIR